MNKEDIEAYNNMQCVYVVIVIPVCTGHSDISMYEPHANHWSTRKLLEHTIHAECVCGDSDISMRKA